MKIYISYFYQVRFFKPYMIPVSTCLFDPAWFSHSGEIYKDKNGVYNGIRCEDFLPPPMPNGCGCPCEQHKKRTGECAFLTEYRKQLDKINFRDFLNWCRRLGDYVQNKEQFEEEPVIVLLVYEAPTNPCSEREPLIDWFAANGMDLIQWKH
jgi:hypothetical protein